MNQKNTENVAAGSPLKRLVMRISDVELRTCDKHLTNSGAHVRAEIVKWHDGEKTCHTIACWDESKEGFDLHFIGARPFDACDGDLFWRLAKAGQDHLDLWFDDRDA